ncbi:hypothetical protein Tco_0498808 [Tanacetum coccineum]
MFKLDLEPLAPRLLQNRKAHIDYLKADILRGIVKQAKENQPLDNELDFASLEYKILIPEPDSSPCCAKCGTPVDGLYCRGCALLRKKFEEDLLTYCVENENFQDSQDTSESSDDNTNIINASFN